MRNGTNKGINLRTDKKKGSFLRFNLKSSRTASVGRNKKKDNLLKIIFPSLVHEGDCSDVAPPIHRRSSGKKINFERQKIPKNGPSEAITL